MNQKTLGLITFFTGVLFVIALCFAILFGVKLAGANKQKASEISNALEVKEEELKAAFQSETEETTVKYVSDDVFGAFEFSYPKVWATNVEQEIGATEELVFLADPKLIVINKEVEGPFTGLRVIVYQEKYANKLKDIEGNNTGVKNPMKEANIIVSGISGKKFTGTDAKSGKEYSYAILPLRDKTLYIGTDDLTTFESSYKSILDSFKISK